MKTLILVRHAKSDWEDNTVKDFDRDLSIRGRRTAPKMANHLKIDGFNPELIVCSKAKRAVETLSYIIEQLEIDEGDIIYSDEVYEASVRVLLGVINQLPPTFDSVAIVGHNPGITYLTELITGEEIGNVPTFGVVKINFDLNSWEEVSSNTGSLDYFIYPKMFDY